MISLFETVLKDKDISFVRITNTRGDLVGFTIEDKLQIEIRESYIQFSTKSMVLEEGRRSGYITRPLLNLRDYPKGEEDSITNLLYRLKKLDIAVLNTRIFDSDQFEPYLTNTVNDYGFTVMKSEWDQILLHPLQTLGIVTLDYNLFIESNWEALTIVLEFCSKNLKRKR